MHDRHSFARDGGCTKPCCTVSAYGCQVHHASTDWGKGGNTNTDDMTLACGPDNRDVDDDTGWQTTINTRGECEWHPPPDLDHGQTRINHYHRPETLLRPTEDKAAPEPKPPKPKQRDDADFNPWDLDTSQTPGGPEPPNDQAA